jgi:hypothetical protein
MQISHFGQDIASIGRLRPPQLSAPLPQLMTIMAYNKFNGDARQDSFLTNLLKNRSIRSAGYGNPPTVLCGGRTVIGVHTAL